ncbi:MULTISPECIES: glycogen synthase GlgA [Exiguobacterium]|uniref:Glycogen synthase n=1 Tax=Exiguobacterium indicum TaxID=296995 RepID=A0AAW3M836_9BACL|nr:MULTISPECIES: glycogen synthase GlgA [Exiguobacterium]KTR25547.1 glycogen synthase [Exiguobacterium indicum]HAK99721.1 glycogen synthase GlgA [Exiguobacterium sp.]
MKVWFAATEATPFIKTGGLADVVGSLPLALAEEGADVSVVLPNYGQIKEQYKSEMEFLFDFIVPVGWRQQFGAVLRLKQDGVTFYFIDNEYYFKRDGVIYGHYDDAERFAYFSRAVLEMIQHLDRKEVPDIIHCHDWQTGVIPAFLRIHYQHLERYQDIKTVFTIHNLQYQGVFPEEVLGDLLGLSHEHFTADGIAHNGLVNYMKAGLVHSNQITTVSPSYRDEIMDPYYGETLEPVLQHRAVDVRGILNGIDYRQFDPAHDTHLVETYSVDTVTEGKAKNKAALQEELGLPINPDVPLFGFVSRLVDQKGIDLLAHILPDLFELDAQFIILGSGEAEYEGLFHHATSIRPDKIASYIGFDVGLAQRIYAGSDAFLMPSRFEPCGLSQLISMKYGCLPVVRETGGLRDTVKPFNQFTLEGNGFSFANYNAHEFLEAIKRTIEVYHDRPVFEHLIETAMNEDFSWLRSADEYLALYRLIAPSAT